MIKVILLFFSSYVFSSTFYYKVVGDKYFLKIGGSLDTFYYQQISYEDFKFLNDNYEMKRGDCVSYLVQSLLTQRRKIRKK